MKIWLTGDLHFNHKQFEYLLQQQKEYDVLCLAGDLLNGARDDFAHQKQWIADFLAQITKPIFVCSGNHDVVDYDEDNHYLDIGKKDDLYLDGRIKTLDSSKFGVMPYYCVDYDKFYNCDVLLTHVPPKNTKTAQTDANGELKDWGDEELYYKINGCILSPVLMLCGHVEQPLATMERVAQTTIINPGANHGGDVPKIEEILF